MNALPSISDYFKTRNRTKLGLHSNRTAWLYIQTVNIHFDLELFFIKDITRQWQLHFYFRHFYGVYADLFFYQCLSMSINVQRLSMILDMLSTLCTELQGEKGILPPPEQSVTMS